MPVWYCEQKDFKGSVITCKIYGQRPGEKTSSGSPSPYTRIKEIPASMQDLPLSELEAHFNKDTSK